MREFEHVPAGFENMKLNDWPILPSREPSGWDGKLIHSFDLTMSKLSRTKFVKETTFFDIPFMMSR